MASKIAMRSSKSHIKSDAHLIGAREAFETGDQSDHRWLRINKEKKNSPVDQGLEEIPFERVEERKKNLILSLKNKNKKFS